jgi:hypothetical protein
MHTDYHSIQELEDEINYFEEERSGRIDQYGKKLPSRMIENYVV